ncbi:MAG: RidA family protein [Saprospiraceae bacterium]|nr:RidA family protein [Saprospiraceae bacterium]
MDKTYINPPELFNSKDFGFSQIVISEPGNLVYISGQVAWDENREITGKGDLETQVQKTIDNLAIAMKKAGGQLQDIVMLRIYIVNYTSAAGNIVSEALRRNFGAETPPASTWLSVQGLANPDFLIEIEAQAVL